MQVLQAVRRSAEPVRIAALADTLGLHPNTARFHLDALVADGLLERVSLPVDGPGRPPLAFRAPAGLDPTGPRHYRLLAAMLAGALAGLDDPVAVATAAGADWGRKLATEVAGEPLPDNASVDEQVELLLRVLDDLGFAPQLRRPPPTRGAATGGRRLAGTAGADRGRGAVRVGLRHCPFLELAKERPVICAVHLGLMRGAAATIGSGLSVPELLPFAEPDACVARLTVPRSP
ncbi:helix-turn-helix transcriptional regulator [Nakamurella lactea]|uniref:helix-turn-helix transcriptional regulator n=1 Tax=Nakamurella lactea TaxID=459515 RepID=UPI00055B4E8A